MTETNFEKGLKIQTCEMHCCGEPVRILEKIEPPITFPKDSDILQKRKYFSENFDFIRKMVMLEPRGHGNMFGVLLTEPNRDSGSDYGVLFMNTIDLLPMCGHITIAVGRYLLEKNLIKKEIPETKIKLDCSCGLVVVSVEWDGFRVGNTKILSVPSFIESLDYEVLVSELGLKVKCDIAFGGNFFAIISAKELGVNFETDSQSVIIEKGILLFNTLKKQFQFSHLVSNEIEYLYAAIIIDKDEINKHTKLLCVFGEGFFDRSPCGSGSTAVTTCQYFRKKLKLNETMVSQNPFLGEHSRFLATPKEEKAIITENGSIKSLLVEISGRAFFTGKCNFTFEETDFFKYGFNI